MIIHVSGSPGSGKTTLGNILQENNKYIVVKDLDDLTDDLDKNDKDIFFKKLHEKIIDFIEQNAKKFIVFVGILDIIFDDVIYIYDFKDADVLFYLDPPMETLLKQFYTRMIKIGEKDETFWSDIAQKKYAIPPSDYKIDEARQTKEEHIKRGYICDSYENIISKIQKIINKDDDNFFIYFF